MNTKRILDILLVFALTLLIFNLFFGPSKDKVPEDTLNISFQASKYTIPASVKVLIQNYTSS
ncbi:MAG: hypothetical protein LBD88_00900 [Candidatus Peribacteria bacterium]|jgi:hypothetical protein|nr:hypothetical protein [Candidatus Peribacteria bacterium]